MSRMQVPYEFFSQGLLASAETLTELGINSYYQGNAPQTANYGFISYHPASGQKPTRTNDSSIVFRDNLFDLEIVLDRDADVDELAPIEEEVMSLFDGKQFITTTSGMVESCHWTDTFDLPYEPVNGTYPRRIMRFEVVV